MRTLLNSILVALVLMILLPLDLFACACCAERGHYSRSESVFDEEFQQDVGKIAFGSAFLYSDAGYPDTIVGISPIGENYTVGSQLFGKSWTLEFADNDTGIGKLILSRPQVVEEYSVDQEPLSEATTVTLYKELRFKYKVASGSGIFEKGISRGTQFELILQGHGNVCMEPSDYKTYILQIKGKNAKFSFFGNLVPNDGRIMQAHIDRAGPAVVPLPRN